MIYRARMMGFLTAAPGQGKRGGALTPKAEAILQEGKPTPRKETDVPLGAARRKASRPKHQRRRRKR